jgi:hypothetical protein
MKSSSEEKQGGRTSMLDRLVRSGTIARRWPDRIKLVAKACLDVNQL